MSSSSPRRESLLQGPIARMRRPAFSGLNDETVRQRYRWSNDRAFVAGGAGYHGAVITLDYIHMTLGIPDNDVIPVKKGRGQFQSVKQFLFPDGGAVPFIIGREIAAVLADINIMTVHRQASVARYVLRPDLIARPGFQAGDPSLIGDGAYLLFVNDRQTGDIGNTLELCGARGRATAASHPAAPFARLIVTSLPPAKPAYTVLPEIRAPAKLRTVSDGVAPW